MPRWLAASLQGMALLGAGLLGALYFFQEKILYVPIIPGVANTYDETPREYGLDYEDVHLTASDGVKLQCWYIKSPRPASSGKSPLLLFFQENAGNMSHRSQFLALAARKLGCAIFVLGYRGYGKSEGSPNQQGLELDSQAALDHVLSREDIDLSRIVLFGRSLGGAVALHLLARSEDTVCAAIVENTFTSVEEMVPRVLPFLGPLVGEQKPMNWLVRNKWRNTEAIASITKTPLLLMGSTNVRCQRCSASIHSMMMGFNSLTRWSVLHVFASNHARM